MRRLSLNDAWTRAGFGLVLAVLAATSLLLPATGAAGAALLALIAGAGAGLAQLAARARPRLPGWALDLVLIGAVCSLSVQLFGRTWNENGLRVYDWGPHHANLAHLVRGLEAGHIPRWVHGVSTGDSPYELYAFLPYYLAARAALLTNATDLMLVLVRSGIVVHTLAAVGAGLLARRLLSLPWALLVGFATLYDIGSVWGGGVEGVMHLGVVHSALANALWPFVLITVLRALRRPSLAVSLSVWASAALAVACHPLALVSALATIGALVLVALLAEDVPRHRALFAALHVGIGAALVAVIWMPFSARLVVHGVHFAEAGRLAWQAFGHMVSQPVPDTSLAPLVYAGYLGVAAGALSRRAAPTLLACFAGILFAGLFDQLYTLLDLVPSLSTGRFQTVRLASAAKIALYVCGAWLVQRALALAPWPASGPQRWVQGALVALAIAGVLRGAIPHFDLLRSDLRSLSARNLPDQEGLRALARWARAQNEAMQPNAYGRLLHEDDGRSYLVYHVNALSGLPTLWIGPISALFLRERIEDASPESLRRFNVRWVMRADRPPSLGDRATEQRFGRYYVRELPDWDGQFARVERGSGRAVVTRLEDERVELTLEETSEPALVALGMGYYPRWEVVHEQRGALPVYALPGVEGGKLRVVAAWLPPGRSVFRPSGALPSDSKGRVVTLGAAVAVLGVILLWAPRRGSRGRLLLLFALARTLALARRQRVALGLGAAALAALGLALAALVVSRRPLRALQVGNGLRGAAVVEARSGGGEWRRCGYMPFYGSYRCAGPVLIQDTTVNLLEDAPPSPPFAVPAIHMTAVGRSVEVRVSLAARLAGEYWAVTNGRNARLVVAGDGQIDLSGRQLAQTFAPSADARQLQLTTSLSPDRSLEVAFVQRAALDPAREYAVPPEQSPFR